LPFRLGFFSHFSDGFRKIFRSVGLDAPFSQTVRKKIPFRRFFLSYFSDGSQKIPKSVGFCPARAPL
jgi:hypothetical protein